MVIELIEKFQSKDGTAYELLRTTTFLDEAVTSFRKIGAKVADTIDIAYARLVKPYHLALDMGSITARGFVFILNEGNANVPYRILQVPERFNPILKHPENAVSAHAAGLEFNTPPEDLQAILEAERAGRVRILARHVDHAISLRNAKDAPQGDFEFTFGEVSSDYKDRLTGPHGLFAVPIYLPPVEHVLKQLNVSPTRSFARPVWLNYISSGGGSALDGTDQHLDYPRPVSGVRVVQVSS